MRVSRRNAPTFASISSLRRCSKNLNAEDFASGARRRDRKFIRSCGLFHQKARDIKAMSQMILMSLTAKCPTICRIFAPAGGGERLQISFSAKFTVQRGSVVADTHCIRLSNRSRLQSKHESRSRRTRSACHAPRKSKRIVRHALVSHGRAAFARRSVLDCEKLCAERGIANMQEKDKRKNRKMTRLTPTVRVVFIIFTTKITKNILHDVFGRGRHNPPANAKNPTCPYYRNGDEYLTVRKQN